MRKSVWRAVIEVGFIVFLFYSNLLMGEFERSGMGLKRGVAWAIGPRPCSLNPVLTETVDGRSSQNGRSYDLLYEARNRALLPWGLHFWLVRPGYRIDRSTTVLGQFSNQPAYLHSNGSLDRCT